MKRQEPMHTDHVRCDEAGCEAAWEGALGQRPRPLGWMTVELHQEPDGSEHAARPLNLPLIHLCPTHAAQLAERYKDTPRLRPGVAIRIKASR